MPENQEQPGNPVSRTEEERLKAESARLMADARKLDAEAAKIEADTEHADAQKAKLEAEAAKLRADAGRAEAQKGKLEAEAKKLKADAEHADAQRDKLEAEAAKLRADAGHADAQRDKLKAEVAKLKADEKKTEEEAKKLRNDTERSELEKKKFKAEISQFARDAKKAEADGKRIDKHEKLLQKQAKSDWGIRDFVRESLLDIMGGVDDAAAKGQTRTLKEGLEGYLPSVTAIGVASSGDQPAERVEFDIAVTVMQDEREEIGEDKQVNAGFKIGLPLPFVQLGAEAGASRQWERTQASSNSSEQANRIRFSVPIIYATQDESPDDD